MQHHQMQFVRGVATAVMFLSVTGVGNAQISVWFNRGEANGASNGAASRCDGEGFPAEEFRNNTTVLFAGSGGSGGTSGGLIDRMTGRTVARSNLELWSSISGGGGFTEVTFQVVGGAQFLEPTFCGEMQSAVSIDDPIVLRLSGKPGEVSYYVASGSGALAGATIRRLDGTPIPSGSLITPGDYIYLTGSFVVYATNGSPSQSISGFFEATFDDNACNIPGSTPTINTNPVGAQGCVGGSAQFSVQAGGIGPISYQWRRGGVLISNGPSGTGSVFSGVNSPMLNISNLQLADAGQTFSCSVASPCGAVVSTGATLGVTAGPIITMHPLSVTGCRRGTITFQTSATGTPPLAYRWRRGGVLLQNGPTGLGSTIQGATTATLVIVNAGAADGGVGASQTYDCVVTNSCGSTPTNAASLRLCFADFNCNGVVNSGDFFTFLGAFFVNDPSADFDGNRLINSQDLFDFLTAFFNGCS